MSNECIYHGTHLSHAILSKCGLYRYKLWRMVNLESTRDGTVLFVMLNPSTATGLVDDPTIRRCIGFTKAWGYRGFSVVNLFALRTPSPQVLEAFKGDAIGPLNDHFIRDEIAQASLLVAAWGAAPFAQNRGVDIARMIPKEKNLMCLGYTKDGYPRHPLYLKTDARPMLFAHGGKVDGPREDAS